MRELVCIVRAVIRMVRAAIRTMAVAAALPIRCVVVVAGSTAKAGAGITFGLCVFALLFLFLEARNIA